MPRQLHDGDKLQFGVAIYRGAESYAPATMRVGIQAAQE